MQNAPAAQDGVDVLRSLRHERRVHLVRLHLREDLRTRTAKEGAAAEPAEEEIAHIVIVRSETQHRAGCRCIEQIDQQDHVEAGEVVAVPGGTGVQPVEGPHRAGGRIQDYLFELGRLGREAVENAVELGPARKSRYVGRLRTVAVEGIRGAAPVKDIDIAID